MLGFIDRCYVREDLRMCVTPVGCSRERRVWGPEEEGAGGLGSECRCSPDPSSGRGQGGCCVCPSALLGGTEPRVLPGPFCREPPLRGPLKEMTRAAWLPCPGPATAKSLRSDHQWAPGKGAAHPEATTPGTDQILWDGNWVPGQHGQGPRARLASGRAARALGQASIGTGWQFK